jgi:hypothetical protein
VFATLLHCCAIGGAPARLSARRFAGGGGRFSDATRWAAARPQSIFSYRVRLAQKSIFGFRVRPCAKPQIRATLPGLENLCELPWIANSATTPFVLGEMTSKID